MDALRQACHLGKSATTACLRSTCRTGTRVVLRILVCGPLGVAGLKTDRQNRRRTQPAPGPKELPYWILDAEKGTKGGMARAWVEVQ